MKEQKMVIIGIDGMDYRLTTELLDKLPNIKGLSDTGQYNALKSVFPPDSIPAWITAYTGKDPSEHGVLESVNYLAKEDDRLKIDTSSFQGITFWDHLSDMDKKVCVINPFLAYPVWPVKGVMVNGPVFMNSGVQVSDKFYTDGLSIPTTLGGIVDFPSNKNRSSFCKKIFEDTKEQMKFGLKLYKKVKPDLFFQTFLTMDRIQHFLWRFCDKDDPSYPGKNQHDTVIEEFYIYIDGVIGKFLDAIDNDTLLLVISDHGHGRRCPTCFHVNEYLRKEGFVFSKAKSKLNVNLIIEKLKNKVQRIMTTCDLDDYMQTIGKLLPNASKIKKGKHITDDNNNIAYLSDFTGVNPFGGVCINRALAQNYEELRKQLITKLIDLQYDNKPVFQWVKTREQIYSGEFLNRFPDILFKMNADLGIGFSLHTDLFTINPTHKKISGGHKDEGVLIMNKGYKNKSSIDKTPEIIDLFPSILDYFKVECPIKSKGKSFLS